MEEDFATRHWHLDKRVPVALIFAMLVQTAGVVWWGATTSERLSNLERRVESTSPQADRLTRVEVKLDNIADAIADIKQTIRNK
jgi:hypothetical protein